MYKLCIALLVAVFLSTTLACGRDDQTQTAEEEPLWYAATLSEGMNFARRGLPNFLASVTGLSTREKWGRWSDADVAPTVTFTFKQPLPKKFTLILSALCTTENENLPIKVLAGTVEKDVLLTSSSKVQRHELSFDLQEPVTTLVVIPAKTSSPQELGTGGDVRHLGIGFVKMSIEPR